MASLEAAGTGPEVEAAVRVAAKSAAAAQEAMTRLAAVARTAATAVAAAVATSAAVAASKSTAVMSAAAVKQAAMAAASSSLVTRAEEAKGVELEVDLDPHPVQASVEEEATMPTERPEAVALVTEERASEVPTVEVMPRQPTVAGKMVATMHPVALRRRRRPPRVDRAAFGWCP